MGSHGAAGTGARPARGPALPGAAREGGRPVWLPLQRKQNRLVLKGASLMVSFHRGRRRISGNTWQRKEAGQTERGVCETWPPLGSLAVLSSQALSTLPAGDRPAGDARLTLICVVFGLQFQLAGLKLVMLHLPLQLLLLLFQGVFKLDEFLQAGGDRAGVTDGLQGTAAPHRGRRLLRARGLSPSGCGKPCHTRAHEAGARGVSQETFGARGALSQ